MTVKASTIEWLNSHDEKLKVSAGDDLALIKQQVKSGAAHLWECSKEGEPQAYVVTRVDGSGESAELVIVLGEGKGFFDFMPLFIDYAKQLRMPIRTHVKRKGLIRMWSRLGLSLDEYVLRG